MNDNINKFLIKADYLGYYKVKTIYLVPKLKKITVYINIKDFTVNKKIKLLNTNTSLQIKAFLLLYILFSKTPKILLKKSKTMLEQYFGFIIIFVNSNEIYDALKYLTIQYDEEQKIKEDKKIISIKNLKIKNTFNINRTFESVDSIDYIFKCLFEKSEQRKIIVKTSYNFIIASDKIVPNQFIFWK